jgi:hypothetical protein
MKIFSLPKNATQASRDVLRRNDEVSRRRRASSARVLHRFKKRLQHKGFLQIASLLRVRVAGSDAFVLRHFSKSSRALRRVLALSRVNTSLSGTLFFFVRWCNDLSCTSIPGAHASVKPSH